MKKLNEIQQKLKANKGQRNTFGNYNYRSCEDILEAVKPLLGDDSMVSISDEIVVKGQPLLAYIRETKKDGTIVETPVDVGQRFYVKSTSTLIQMTADGKNHWKHEVSGFAREPQAKKGMDEAQITGATSSYARKYALNGLFCIDDAKDADATNKHGKEETKYVSPFQAYVDATGLSETVVKERLRKAGITTLDQMKKGKFDDLITIIKETK